MLGIGLVHLFLIWNGDILVEYALAGFIVLPFLFGPRWLLAAGSLFFLALYPSRGHDGRFPRHEMLASKDIG